ncbi:hypothetical protein PHPALM_3268 [Phytophthora palmivora]|uniref:HTH CENPB-type domain-containing protein n=1 Tax=Phytophthora palmivora TaxID=4796 RepID=A0A2P4YMT6_9STRA|nr:hypothetical protein PHPALM_3268 [Phytophthora palmivora]
MWQHHWEVRKPFIVESWFRKKLLLKSNINRKACNKKKARPKGLCTRLPAEAENKLVVWVNDLRKEGVSISHLMLRLEALDLAVEYNDHLELSMGSRARQRQKTPEQLDQVAAAFADKIKRTMLDLAAFSSIFLLEYSTRKVRRLCGLMCRQVKREGNHYAFR